MYKYNRQGKPYQDSRNDISSKHVQSESDDAAAENTQETETTDIAKIKSVSCPAHTSKDRRGANLPVVYFPKNIPCTSRIEIVAAQATKVPFQYIAGDELCWAAGGFASIRYPSAELMLIEYMRTASVVKRTRCRVRKAWFSFSFQVGGNPPSSVSEVSSISVPLYLKSIHLLRQDPVRDWCGIRLSYSSNAMMLLMSYSNH